MNQKLTKIDFMLKLNIHFINSKIIKKQVKLKKHILAFSQKLSYQSSGLSIKKIESKILFLIVTYEASVKYKELKKKKGGG